MQIVVFNAHEIDIKKALSEAEIRYLTVALLLRAYAVTPTLKSFISLRINAGTSIIQHNACFTGCWNGYRLKHRITQREDEFSPTSFIHLQKSFN